jgi:sortase B
VYLLRRLARTCLSCLMAVSVTLSCFYGGNEVYISLQARRANQQEAELEQIYRQGETGTSWEEGREMDPRLASLYAINPDLVGWLELGGENAFSAPVVQRDNTYYLKHDFYGKEDRHGAVFLDYRNETAPRDDSLILYGHNMNDGAWFHYLVNYQSPEFVAADPMITFDTLREKGEYVVAGVFVAATLPQHGDDFDYHNRTSFDTIEEKQDYLDRIARRSLLNTGVEVTVRDELLTLSTCLYDFAGERLVVVARRLRNGESPKDFENLPVTRAQNPEMPAIWNQLYG